MASERVVLVDGSWLIFRAFYAIPSSFGTTSGLHTNAIFGFANMFRRLMAGRTPVYGAVVFDPSGPTQRDLTYPAYKAERPAMENDLREQIPWIDKVVAAHNFPLIRVPGWEADDVIGTLSRMATEAGHEVVIVSSDKDFAQLISDKIRMLDTMRDVSYDADLALKKWGARPERIIDLLGLMGDKVDNIPGVPGVGKKTAARLLEQFGSLEGVYENVESLKGKLKQNLIEHHEAALMSKELVTINQHADINVTLEDIRVSPTDPAVVNALFKELEFFSLLGEEANAGDSTTDDATYSICGDIAAVEALVERARGCAAPSLYLQFNLLNAAPEYGGLAGVAIGVADDEAGYVPLEATSGGLGVAALEALTPWLEDADAPKVAHNAGVAFRELKRRGIHLRGIIGDTMLASFLVEPTKVIPHDLPRIAKEYLQRVLHQPKGVVGSGKKLKRFGEVEAEQAGSFAGHYGLAIYQAWPVILGRLEKTGLEDHLYEHDLPLSWVLADMELNGIRVDKPDLERLGIEFRERLGHITAEIHELAGREFNINSTKQLGVVLFEDLGLPPVKRTKTGYSTSVQVLEKLATEHPIATRLLDHRKLSKLINTYTDVLTSAVNPDTGRVHATFNQTVSATGRLITTDPDLQRTPVRTDEGKRIRRAFIAAPGHKLISADWSQIELRLLAHITGDPALRDAFLNDVDVHRKTASELFDVPVEEISPQQRGVGKTVNFATIYGQGATALGKILGIPRKQAKAYIEEYFATYAQVRVWLDATIATALETGYVETLSNRRRYIPALSSKNPLERQGGERIAANTPIQGSAADICKEVMLVIPARLEAAGLHTRMLLQIHDELLFEAPDDEVEASCAIIKEAMETVTSLAVPLVADVGVGPNWDAAHL